MTSSIPQLIESCGFCRAGEVEGLQKMKTGMTNRSYSFFARGGQYIIRVPGEGTEQMINRAQEHAVYNVIAPLGISEEVHYFDPMSGIKISSYLKGTHTCHSDDWEEDDAECWILKDTSPEESSEAIYEFVEDEKELNGIMGVFEELLEDVEIER